MFTDARSKKVIFVSHCILNQNSISDATADFPGTFKNVLGLIIESEAGIVQMPCPELLCLGLDRGDIHGGKRDVLLENTRIREKLQSTDSTRIIDRLVQQVVYQLEEYLHNGFTVLGIIGVNRSPSCGVNTTSKENKEADGKGVFMEKLEKILIEKNISIDMIGIKTSKEDEALEDVKKLLKL